MVGRKKPALILLVEDDPGDQELIRRALQEGAVAHDLHVVEDGAAALDYLFCRGNHATGGDCPMPELILLDLNLPKMDGLQVLRQIRQDARLQYTPTLVLSTSQQEKDIRQCYDSGASSYIVKPVVLDDYIRLIRRIDEYWFQTVSLFSGEGGLCAPPT